MFIRVELINRWLISCVLFLALAASAGAGVYDDVGFTQLKNELGDKLPTGESISVIQVESSQEAKNSDYPGPVLTWVPDPNARALRGVRITDRSGAPEKAYSGHATAVARRMVGQGKNQGLASKVAAFDVYSVMHWLGAGMLHGRTGLAPKSGPARLINHSWASPSKDSQVLRRSDWLTDRDEVIQVVGVRNAEGKPNHSLMAAAANAIVVGRSDGKHSVGTVAINKIYPDGRTRPHLVAPLKTGSAAAPTVASAAIVLLDMSRNASLSTRSQPVENRGGQLIFDAGRSEVIRAVLMASADRSFDYSNAQDINGYRDSDAHRTDNGLDNRFGAGQLNIHKAWHIMHAGEQEPEQKRGLSVCGFDYEPALAQRKTTRRYDLPEVTSARQIAATLSWNLLFPNSHAIRFDASAILNDLDLSLYETHDGAARLVQRSQSRVDTTETILADLIPGKRYHLLVSRVDKNRLDQDYAIAWYTGGDEAAH